MNTKKMAAKKVNPYSVRFRDIMTGAVKTKKTWILHYNRMAKKCRLQWDDVTGSEIFASFVEDGHLVQVGV